MRLAMSDGSLLTTSMADVTLTQRLLFGLLALALLAVVARLLHRREMELRQGVPWMVAITAGLAMAAFPEGLLAVSRWLGFKAASNAALSLAIVGLVFICLMHSVAETRARRDLRDLSQRMALLEERLGRFEGRSAGKDIEAG